MNLYSLAQRENLYRTGSAYGQALQPLPNEYLVHWPRYINTELWQSGVRLLQEAVAAPGPASDDLTAQVFGHQLRQQKLSLKHLAHLLYERAVLYSRHMAELRESHLKVQEQLFCEKIMSGSPASRRQLSLEGLLFQLEGDKRKEELDFWKDSRDIRETMFEGAGEYQSASHRAQLLSGIGGGDE